MIAAALFLLLTMQQPAPTVVWEAPAPEAETPAASAPVQHSVPDWGVADPFGYERARCSPLVRGEKTVETCQAEVRTQLALALGDRLPDGLRPAGMADDCEMAQAQSGGSAYVLQCGARSRPATASSLPQEMECRSRPEGGGFTSECRPVNAPASKGLSLKLWGDD